MRIDLHIHSTFSDGVYSPAEIVEIAHRNGVEVLSIADHDCVDGVPEAIDAANGYDVEVVSGVELSSEFDGRDLHILGYGFDSASGELTEMLKRFRDTREKRGLAIIEKLKEQGVELDPEELLKKSPDGSLGRPHIAETLIESGYVYTHAEAFAKYLGEHCPAYVKKYKLTPQEAIQYIQGANGLAFIAHPGNYLKDYEKFDELISMGFDGMEIVHPNHSNEETRQLRAIAEKHGILMSGGTDYHGFHGKDISIGSLQFPVELWAQLKNELDKRH
jgi:predicted metal-dependent phosphoesterase TrpH